uniref:Uncharacterized protein n=1 Tax=Quercus lobata TaxID=97700 RepID=A0A7N2L6Q2_QUELO
MGKLQKLERLMVTDNLFSGEIPDIFCNLTWLYELDMANNSDSLPNEFGHLRQLQIMDICGNQLSGNIPAITEKYSILQRLNIARNKITGSIPKSLENLAAPKRLDLSSNNLSGLMRTELENLNALQVLNLSFNSLERGVPKNEYSLGGKASTSGDVYSFGILLLGMIIAKKPTDGIFPEGLSINKLISKVHESKIMDIADPRLFKDNEPFL